MKCKVDLPTLPPLDARAARAAMDHWNRLAKPKGSLGRIEQLGVQLAAIQGKTIPTTDRKTIVLAAADHGVTVEGVSAYPSAVTRGMIDNFLRGEACINALARRGELDLLVVDVGVDGEIVVPKDPIARFVGRKIRRGTRNFAVERAMDREEAIRSIDVGRQVTRECIDRGADVIGLGEMGIGNTTASTAIICGMLHVDPRSVTGAGTGLSSEDVARKARVIEKGLKLHRPDRDDPIDVLTKVGGFEIGALAGSMIEAASKRCPIVLDGLVTGAAALIAWRLDPRIREFLIASHCSHEPGHRYVLNHLGLKPLLDLQLRLGEGSGAALAMGLLDATTAMMRETAVFSHPDTSDVDVDPGVGSLQFVTDERGNEGD